MKISLSLNLELWKIQNQQSYIKPKPLFFRGQLEYFFWTPIPFDFLYKNIYKENIENTREWETSCWQLVHQKFCVLVDWFCLLRSNKGEKIRWPEHSADQIPLVCREWDKLNQNLTIWADAACNGIYFFNLILMTGVF